MLSNGERTKAIYDALCINTACKISALDLQKNGDLTMFIVINNHSFSGLIFVEDNSVGIQLSAPVFSEDVEKIKEKIERANGDTALLDKDKRWVRFGLTKKRRIAVVAMIESEKEENNKSEVASYFDDKFSSLIRSIERNWFIFER